MIAATKKRDRPKYFETRTVHAGDLTNEHLLALIHADRERQSPSDITWLPVTPGHFDDAVFAGFAGALSPIDAMAYESYVHRVALVGVQPYSAEVWLAKTRGDVEYAMKRWKNRERGGESDAPSTKKSRLSPHDQLVIADLAQQFGEGLQVGELRRGGGLGGSVRPQTVAVIEEKNISPLTSRSCRKCKKHLPAVRFSTKRGIIREICKSCDNRARVARRKANKEN